MNERQYEASFAPPIDKKGDHEHVWVPSQQSGILEECSVPGCSMGRYSRSWLEQLKQQSPIPS